MCDRNIEATLDTIRDCIIYTYTDKGYDIIIDNTHCKISYIKSIIEKYAPKCFIEIVVLDAPLYVLKFRNIVRYIKERKWIPVQVIKRMKENLEAVKEFAKDITKSK